MDFFAAQQTSLRRTRLLVFFYLLATLAVAAAVTAIFAGVWLWAEVSPIEPDAAWLQSRWQTLTGVAGITIGFIALASLYRIVSLRGGGARIARELGANPLPPDTGDPLRRRLRNVVEEMAIASGVPVPEIYVLEQEGGINAFAAGYLPEDAVVAVTRGALEQLDREELQGVIGHEFSHILNGDMRLNVRMLGPLFGITIVGLLGRTLLRNLRLQRSFGSSRKSSGALPVVLVAAGLVIVGWVGVTAARMIKAGVSRQREYLADASAVQFTRQPQGIAGALKKIGGLKEQSWFTRADSEEVNHMLFATGAPLRGWFATHPPLDRRILRLDPDFDGKLMPPPSPPLETGPSAAGMAAAQASGDQQFAIDPQAVPEQAGNPDASQVAAAHGLHRSIPPALFTAAHSDTGALLLTLSLALHRDPELREPQLAYLAQRLGPARAAEVAELEAALRGIGPQFRLPLLDLAFPALKRRPDGQQQFTVELLEHLVHLDARIELFEYCLVRIVQSGLLRARLPWRRTARGRSRAGRLREALLDLFAILARQGHEDAVTAAEAFAAGVQALGIGLVPGPDDSLRGEQDWQTRLDQALPVLASLRDDDRRRVVAALARTASHDRQITVAESELLRACCAMLETPLPPLYAATNVTA
jgi:Zn-dependent protease with chaperone function